MASSISDVSGAAVCCASDLILRRLTMLPLLLDNFHGGAKSSAQHLGGNGRNMVVEQILCISEAEVRTRMNNVIGFQHDIHSNNPFCAFKWIGHFQFAHDMPPVLLNNCTAAEMPAETMCAAIGSACFCISSRSLRSPCCGQSGRIRSRCNATIRPAQTSSDSQS